MGPVLSFLCDMWYITMPAYTRRGYTYTYTYTYTYAYTG